MSLFLFSGQWAERGSQSLWVYLHWACAAAVSAPAVLRSVETAAEGAGGEGGAAAGDGWPEEREWRPAAAHGLSGAESRSSSQRERAGQSGADQPGDCPGLTTSKRGAAIWSF